MHFLYNLGIWAYQFIIGLAASFSSKAQLWVAGREQWEKRYKQVFQKKCTVLWVHVASLGEFEQGRPIIEAFRAQNPHWQIVLSFFSPSGFEIRKDYPLADFVCYLPADTPEAARAFLDIIQPDAALFVKYEFWANYLFELKRRHIPTLLVSAVFRPQQPFFKWYGGFWRRMLQSFTHIFVQEEASAKLLNEIGYSATTVAGDTRVDRVLEIAASAPENEIMQAFCLGNQVFIAGSSWETDEAVFIPVLAQEQWQHYKIVIAPHAPTEKHIAHLEQQIKHFFPEGPRVMRYTKANKTIVAQARILIIDNIGLLNRLYRFAHIAYIGGGFGKGIHNTLEPAAFGLPVLFGPNYQKFEEAKALIKAGGAFVLTNSIDLNDVLLSLKETHRYLSASSAVQSFMQKNKGATQRILNSTVLPSTNTQQ